MFVFSPPASLCTTELRHCLPHKSEISPIPSLAARCRTCSSCLPVCVGIIDHQQDPGLLNDRCGGAQRLHQPQGGLRGLLHGTGEGAKKAGPWRGEGGCQGLRVPPLHGRGSRGAGGAVWALQVRHVAIRQVGHKAAVGKPPPEEIHGCGWMRWLVPPQTCLGEASTTGCSGEGVLGSWTRRARGILQESASAVFVYLWK